MSRMSFGGDFFGDSEYHEVSSVACSSRHFDASWICQAPTMHSPAMHPMTMPVSCTMGQVMHMTQTRQSWRISWATASI